MSITRLVVLTVLIGLVLGCGVVSGQTFPNKPLRIVTAAAGGLSDLTSRTIAQGISGPLGQPVIVDNRGFFPSMETVMKALPDGYTLLVQGSGIWVTPLLTQTSWDALKDFLPISQTYAAPNILVVHPSVPANSVKELIAYAKARPGELNYSSTASGTLGHITMELFKSMAGVNVVRIPYKGNTLQILALLANEVQMTIDSGSALMPAVKTGKLRALAVTSAQPSELYPGLNTMAASGLPGYELVSINGVFAPAKTPAVIIDRLNQEIVRVLNTKQAKDVLLSAGAELVPSSPAQFAAKIKNEIVLIGKVVKDAGIKAD